MQFEERQLTVKWNRYLSKFHKSLYLLIPKEYVRAMELDKDILMEIKATTTGALIIRPVPSGEGKNDRIV